MKRIEITESDEAYRKGLSEILIAEGAAPVVFEVPDAFDYGRYEGVVLAIAAQAPQPLTAEATAEEFADVSAWLEAYTGTFEFYLSLKTQWRVNGRLSTKQIDAVRRAIARDKESGRSLPEGQKVPEFSLKVGTTLIVTKFTANRIAKDAGYDRAHRALDVLNVIAESEKAYRVQVKLSAKRTSYCGICGLLLENKDSLAAGIGPICADNYGIPYGENSLDELNVKLYETRAVVTWVPKSAIKGRLEVSNE